MEELVHQLQNFQYYLLVVGQELRKNCFLVFKNIAYHYYNYFLLFRFFLTNLVVEGKLLAVDGTDLGRFHFFLFDSCIQ